MTFSVVARCSRTGMLGVAISTAIPAVGALCPFVAPRAGAVSTQAWVNPYLGIDGLRLLGHGHTAHETLEQVLSRDPGAELRQLGVVDVRGNAACHTGRDCTGWAGHRTGEGYAVQGNMLTGSDTVAAMEESFHASGGEDLSERLVRTLEAGQAAGGDRRGRQSAALKVHAAEEYAYLDLRVDDHPDPVAELRRLHTVAQRQVIPFVDTMVTRDRPAGRHDDSVANFLLLSPEERSARP